MVVLLHIQLKHDAFITSTCRSVSEPMITTKKSINFSMHIKYNHRIWAIRILASFQLSSAWYDSSFHIHSFPRVLTFVSRKIFADIWMLYSGVSAINVKRVWLFLYEQNKTNLYKRTKNRCKCGWCTIHSLSYNLNPFSFLFIHFYHTR